MRITVRCAATESVIHSAHILPKIATTLIFSGLEIKTKFIYIVKTKKIHGISFLVFCP